MNELTYIDGLLAAKKICLDRARLARNEAKTSKDKDVTRDCLSEAIGVYFCVEDIEAAIERARMAEKSQTV
jgi:hypothetical protein